MPQNCDSYTHIGISQLYCFAGNTNVDGFVPCLRGIAAYYSAAVVLSWQQPLLVLRLT
jgi:hypothetical protein